MRRKGWARFLSNIIRIKNLNYTYMKGTPFEKKALEDINLEIEKGEFVALIGHTGSGKSTLMNILYGLYSQDEGQVFLNGQEVEINEPTDAIQLGIGMVHQHLPDRCAYRAGPRDRDCDPFCTRAGRRHTRLHDLVDPTAVGRRDRRLGILGAGRVDGLCYPHDPSERE